MATADMLNERTSERLAVGPIVEKLMRPLASLKLTVSLLAMSVFIVLAGTMAQVDKDIWEVVDKYFRCGIAWIPLQIFFPPSFFPSKPQVPGVIPFPGGWTIGTLMFLNLVAAHGLRFVPQAKGGRLWGGVGVVALGFLTTWMVVVSGSNPDGIQHEGWLSWDSIWFLFKLGLTALFIGLVVWMKSLTRSVSEGERSTTATNEPLSERSPSLTLRVSGGSNRIQYWAGLGCGVLLGVTTLALWLKGEDAQLDDSSMRILWQLVKGTFAGLVLLAGCVMLFKKRAGVVLLHGGIGLMMLSELLVGVTAVESQIALLEGDRTNFARDIRNMELAVVEANGTDEETHVVVPGKKLLASQEGDKVAHELLPFDVKVVSSFKNADVRRTQDGDENPATEGLGTAWIADAAEASTGTDSGGKVDYPAAYVKLTKRGTDEPIGTYLVSVLLSEEGRADQVKVGDKTYDLSLRFTRHYKPYTVELKDVRKDDYLGTDTPRDYRSYIRMVNESSNQDFDYQIWMNNPLRYSGETFYQSGYHKVPTTGIEGTSLAVVTNSGWMIPYVACMIVAVALLFHFSVTLVRFLDRRNRGTVVGHVSNVPGSPDDGKSNRNRRNNGHVENVPHEADATLFWIPVVAVTILGLWVASKARTPNVQPDEFDYAAFGQLPIVAEGRVKPIDTYARNQHRILSGKETFKREDKADPKKTTNEPAIRWLLDVIARPEEGQRHKVIRIDNPEVLNALGLERRKGFLYAPNEFTNLAHEKDLKYPETLLGKLSQQASAAHEKKTKDLSVTERKILEFERKFGMHFALSEFALIPRGDDKNPEFDLVEAHSHSQRMRIDKMPLVIPPRADSDVKSKGTAAGNDWAPFSLAALLNPVEANKEHREWARQLVERVEQQIAPAMTEQLTRKDLLPFQQMRLRRQLKQFSDMAGWLRERYLADGAPNSLEENPAVEAWMSILKAYAAGDAKVFNAQVARYRASLESRSLPEVSLAKVSYESFFNYFQPFFLASMSYFMVFVVATLAWLGWTRTLNRTAFWMICFTLLLHTFALVSRIYISGRPPVTNLYSSAVFISWGTVVLGLILESVFRLGIGNVVAAVTGFAGLLIAHYLAGDGDTFTVLQAVLDTQFWLATHVTTINLGYATVFLAGMMGVMYVLRGFFTKSLTPDVEKNLARMIYGTLCFGIFFSFVGTVLGGLWADDSWGRFWGWDPKENGALIIVLWTALVLHAHWDGMVKNRGMAVLAIGGNIATSWSWFGVNELGVGLHSYGFTEGVLLSLGVFVISQLVVIGIGCLPKSMWASFRGESAAVS